LYFRSPKKPGGNKNLSFPCRFCDTLLFPQSGKKTKYFEDDARTIFHFCPGSKTNHRTVFDKKLLAQTITRVSKLEKQLSVTQKQLDILLEKV
jgi:hypothetical protein